MPEPPPITSASEPASSLMCLPPTSFGPDRTRPAVPDSWPGIPWLGRLRGTGARSVMTTRDVETASGDGVPAHWKVAIVGAGPGGLGLAIQLVEADRGDFVLFEASDGVGGTWRTNTYPGAACDVPSHLYSYSFALKADWSKTYADQPEILRYFEDCADRFGIRPHLRTNTRITAAAWDAEVRRWRLTDADGGTCEADGLASAIGTFTTPSLPGPEGLATFAGPCFHSARWEHEHDLADRRVAVIGTGASAAQIVPELA